jgi:hypothetical protein
VPKIPARALSGEPVEEKDKITWDEGRTGAERMAEGGNMDLVSEKTTHNDEKKD